MVNRARSTGLIVLIILTVLLLALPALAADPSGAETINQDQDLAADYVWVLVCGFLVFFMQAGFAMVEAGFCRAKNATNLLSKNLMDFVMASLVFLAVGYALMKGEDAAGLFGTTGWFLYGEAYDVGTYLDFFWQLVFAGTAATIVAGAMAERLKFPAYLIYSVVVSSLIYPLYGHWVWGGGWLSQLPFGVGHVDFA
ncbi:MAG: ammonium transporter, partial [Clostridia bacterium]|nr:ammonium transporter [Clostridia bacterium]